MVSAQLADPRFTGSVSRGPFFLEKKASSSARGRLGPQLVHTAADSFVLVCVQVYSCSCGLVCRLCSCLCSSASETLRALPAAVVDVS